MEELGSVAVQGEQSPHEAAGTLCLLRGAELGWPHSAASAITLTHPPASDTDSAGRGVCIPSALQPPGWSAPGWLDAPFTPGAAHFRQAPASLSRMPTRCHPADVTSAGSACRAAGAHGVDGSHPPWGPALAPGTDPRTAPTVPPVSTGPRQHEGPGRGGPRCQRGPRRRLGTGSLPACATCGLCGEGCRAPHRTPHCLRTAVPCLPHNHGGHCPHTAHTACALPRAAHTHGPASARPARAALSTAQALPIPAHGKGSCLPILL